MIDNLLYILTLATVTFQMFVLVGSSVISTIVGYLMPNPVLTYILNEYKFVNTFCRYIFKQV